MACTNEKYHKDIWEKRIEKESCPLVKDATQKWNFPKMARVTCKHV